MPTVRDLVYLNRNFRKECQTALSSHRGPFNAILWPILYLAVKIMKHNEALELLASREFGSEAGIVLRSMFEAVVNLLWISKDPELRIKRYTAYQLYDSQKYRDITMKRESTSNITNAEIQQVENDFKQLYQDAQKIGEEFGFKPNKHWSGKSLKEMAKEIGWSERYDILYKIYSDITHSNILSLRDYVAVDNSGSMRVNIQPQVEHSKACLAEAHLYLVMAFGFLDAFLDLNMEAVIDKALLRLPKV